MADPHWTSYVGMVSGLAGAILSVISYRKSNSIKKLDLRLELRREINNTLTNLAALSDLLPYANRSRSAVASATGNFHSGAMQRWNNEFEEDNATLVSITERAPSPETNYDSLNTKELEAKLIEVHSIQSEINTLTNKYQAAVDSDDNERNHIREDIRAQHVPRS